MSGNTDDDEEPQIKRNRNVLDDSKATSSPMAPFTASSILGSSRRDRSSSIAEKPAELFRKDLISAMKMADSEHLEDGDYLLLQDPWRMDWEKGVQVPVCPEAIPDLQIQYLKENENLHGAYAFKLPSKKFLHAMKDEDFRSALHEVHECHKMAEDTCRYDLDDIDVSWLGILNTEREAMGEESVPEWRMEIIMEALETRCYNNMQNMIKTVEGLGIEYDEDVVCDVCRSPEGEDGNEMVFCDSCDLCVHQACYGINTIPEGSWLCRTCVLGVNPSCMFCPKLGGAMKSTKSGYKWAHVVCALWIPEVSFLNPEKMDAITNVTQIPNSRWQLVCSVCREKTGACVQCSVKSCKVAFHVTCAIQAGYEMNMKNCGEDEDDEGFLKGYCRKHTKKKGDQTPRKSDTPKKADGLTPKKEHEMTEEEKTQARSAKLAKLAEEFYECVTAAEVATELQLDLFLVELMHAYWILKRKANFNKPLITPKIEEGEVLSKQEEDSLLARMKMFIHLRQDLERVRNLCYMVSRREKISKQLNTMKEDVFRKQVEVLEQDPNNRIGRRDMLGIVEAHRLKDCIYDEHDLIMKVASLCEARDREEAKVAEATTVANKPRIKLEGRRQNDNETKSEHYGLGNEKQLPRKRGRKPKYSETMSDIDVLNITDEGEPNLKEVREKVKEEVLETASVSSLSLSKQTSHSNLRVKDQNKMTPKEVIERVKKDARLRRDRRSSLRDREDMNGVHRFRKSQLIVPRAIKEKVQNALQISSEKRLRSNGLCSHVQAKMDRYLRHQKENQCILPNKNNSNTTNNSSQDPPPLRTPLNNSPVLRNGRQTRSQSLVESELDSDATGDSLYEPVDGEVSIRSSREASPVRGPRRISPKKRGISRLALEKRLSERLRKHRRGESETESGQEADSESELSFYGDNKQRTLRRRSQKTGLLEKATSQRALSLGRRGRLSEPWTNLTGHLTS